MSYYRVFGAKRRHAKTRQMVTCSCFRMATFRPATRNYDTFHASTFRLLFVVSLPGGAKGRHAKTRKSHHLAGFRVATFRFFAHVCRIFAWRGEKSPRENPPKTRPNKSSVLKPNVLSRHIKCPAKLPDTKGHRYQSVSFAML